jgi:hypothetical protein
MLLCITAESHGGISELLFLWFFNKIFFSLFTTFFSVFVPPTGLVGG